MSVTVITGGASVIALAVAERLVADGGEVILGDLRADLHAEVTDRIGDAGTYLAGDVTDDSYLDTLVAAAAERGSVTGLVHAAVTFADRRYETTRAEWQRAFDINVTSAAVLTHKVTPHMVNAGGGAVVYVSSVSGHRAQPARMVYSVTKSALHMLAKTGGTQLAPHGIRVNTVSPGWTWSRSIADRYGSREYADSFAGEFQTMGRMADPAEIAAAVVWLLSDEASFVTGTDLAVDGGYTALSPEALGQPFEKYPAPDNM